MIFNYVWYILEIGELPDLGEEYFFNFLFNSCSGQNLQIYRCSSKTSTSTVRMGDDVENCMMTLQEWSGNNANHLKYYHNGDLQSLLTTFV